MINKLIKLANALDALGFKEEARMVGFLMEKKASPGWGSD